MLVDELIPRLIADVTYTKQNNSASYNLILTKNKDLINKLIENAGDDIEEKKKKFITHLNKLIVIYGNKFANDWWEYTEDSVLTCATELEAASKRNEWYLKILETYKNKLSEEKTKLDRLDRVTPQNLTEKWGGGRTIKPRRKTNRRR